ncbi:MAG: hypothetical protein CL946_01735 [Ectothiorhodospiraceae bacterium]|nr:hypothetical protein [Ectothiorhodospiraceae bacterium]
MFHRPNALIVAIFIVASFPVLPMSVFGQEVQPSKGVERYSNQQLQFTVDWRFSSTKWTYCRLSNGYSFAGDLIHCSERGMLYIGEKDTPSATDYNSIVLVEFPRIDSISLNGDSYALEGAGIGFVLSFFAGMAVYHAGGSEAPTTESIFPPELGAGAVFGVVGAPIGLIIGHFIRDDGPGALVHTDKGHAEAIDNLQDYQLYDEDDPELLDLLQRIEEAEAE